MADEWSIDFSEIDALVSKLEKADANMEYIAKKAINATTPIVKAALRDKMPWNEKGPRVSAHRTRFHESWRTGKHARDDINVGAFKVSLRGSLYRVVGPSPGDNSPYFYMKFFEHGRGVYSRKTGGIVGYQEPRSYIEQTVNAVRGQIIETMLDILSKELDL